MKAKPKNQLIDVIEPKPDFKITENHYLTGPSQTAPLPQMRIQSMSSDTIGYESQKTWF